MDVAGSGTLPRTNERSIELKLKPGPVATREQFERAQFVQQLRSTELDRVREAAKNWRTGLAGLLALITTVTVVKGKATLGDLDSNWQIIEAGLMLAALVAAGYGAYRSLRASFGMPRLVSTRNANQDRFEFQGTKRAISDLRWAIGLTYATLGFLAIAVGVSWFAPAAATNVRVTTASTQVCGVLIGMDQNIVTVRTSPGVAQRVSFQTVRTLEVVQSC